MPTGNFDQEVTPGTPPPSERAFRFPAHYYSSPVSEVRPVFPRWVPLGCGSLSAVVLVVLFVAGAFITGSKLGELVDLMLGTTLGELRTMYAPDVTAAQKSSFESEVKAMREGIRARKVPVQDVQPFLKAMQGAVSDKKVTPTELERLTKAAREAASAPSKQKPKVKQAK
jgi:hypothetical protein